MKIKKENCLIPLIFGMFMVLSYLGMRLICHGKYDFLHIISEKIAFPPMWLFNFLYMITLFFFGVAIGFFLGFTFKGGHSVQTENLFLKGAVFSVAVYFLSLLWYPALFVLQMPMLSLIISIISVVFVILTLILWLRACAAYGVFVIPSTIWSVYLNILNFTLIFAI